MEFEEQVGAVEAAIRGLEAPAEETAQAIDAAFARAGRSLAGSLARAAADGKISLRELASAVIGAVEQAAGGGQGGLAEALKQVFSGGFTGARAEGGFVGSGGAYLVGERGPEVFRPSVSGTVEGAGVGPVVNVTLVVPGGVEALVRSEAQVAGMLQRAARMGVR